MWGKSVRLWARARSQPLWLPLYILGCLHGKDCLRFWTWVMCLGWSEKVHPSFNTLNEWESNLEPHVQLFKSLRLKPQLNVTQSELKKSERPRRKEKPAAREQVGFPWSRFWRYAPLHQTMTEWIRVWKSNLAPGLILNKTSTYSQTCTNTEGPGARGRYKSTARFLWVDPEKFK